MKNLYFLITLLVVVFSTAVSAQNVENNNQGKFNLPPGYKMGMKTKIYDLSHKLSGEAAPVKYSSKNLKFLKDISDEELEKTKNQIPDYYNYYIEGLNFINSLSPKVKTIYTKEELWYIYAFDQNLKAKLTTIK